MEKILVLVHAAGDAGPDKAAREALGAAAELAAGAPGAELAVGVVGPSAAATVAGLGGYPAGRVLAVEGAEFGMARYASDAAAAAALVAAAAATVVVAAGTSRWARVLPGVAQRMGGTVDTHVTATAATADGISISRWFYRQRIEGTLARSRRPWFILVDPGSRQPWVAADADAAATAAPPVEPVAVPVGDPLRRTTVVGERAPELGAQTIRPEAEVLFVAGAGWTKKQADGATHVPDAERLILDFLRLTRASLGSTKSLVDLGGEGQAVLSFLTHLNQIGQTGATPRHPKGLAACCHGEEPHTVGWRFVGERRAISLDPNCGWARGKADVLYVADAFAVMENVNALLAAGR